jgi:hypothetical protein
MSIDKEHFCAKGIENIFNKTIAKHTPNLRKKWSFRYSILLGLQTDKTRTSDIIL